LQNVESASFVSPKWVPQMAEGAAVMAGIERRPGNDLLSAHANLRGFEAALDAKVDEIVIFGAASEAFSQKNINCSIAEASRVSNPSRRPRKKRACACAAAFRARWVVRTRATCRSMLSSMSCSA